MYLTEEFCICREAPIDTNQLLLSSNGSAGGPGDAGDSAVAAEPREKKLTKSQQRKARRVQEEKAAREQRATVLQDLAQHSLCAGELALLRPTAHRGQAWSCLRHTQHRRAVPCCRQQL